MNYRVHYAFYVDVQDVSSAAEARDVADEVIVVGDLLNRHLGKTPPPPSFVPILEAIRQNLRDRARAWFTRAELRR